MHDFIIWFETGIKHIADVNGYDHILFLLVLCAPYTLQQKLPLFWLISCFTIGHSLSLAAAVLGWFKPNIELIEFLIPLTILITASSNFIQINQKVFVSVPIKSIAALFFGLIHGLGFSFLLSSLLGNGNGLIFPLFAFNLGLEAGQILIIMILLLVTAFFLSILPNKDLLRMRLFSGLGAMLSIWLLIERFPAIKQI